MSSSIGTSERWTLRDLPFAARLTAAVFLVSVGVGYFSALVQLHFQHAKPGALMPTGDDAVEMFHGRTGEAPKSQLVRLIEAKETEKFNGSGQMSAAFTKRSEGWSKLVRKRGEAAVRKEREGEKAAVLAWLRDAKADKTAYQKDRFPLKGELADLTITPELVDEEGGGRAVKIKSLWTARCVRCHAKEGGEDAKAAQFPLEKWEEIAKYNQVDAGSAMSLTKLAQTTHVHLLGFSVLYGLTGLLFAMTRYPALLRVPIAPLALAAQVVDISFWWLARLDAPHGPMFAQLIPISGMVVATALGLQIVLTLFDLFGRLGKLVLLLLIVAAAAGGLLAKQRIIDPYIDQEKAAAVATQQAAHEAKE